MAKKPKAETPPTERVTFTAEPSGPMGQARETVTYTINEPKKLELADIDAMIDKDNMAEIKRPLIDTKAIAIIRDEIEAELPKIRNICPAVSFFCDEALRALAALDDNQKAYSNKMLIEARQRAAESQGGK